MIAAPESEWPSLVNSSEALFYVTNNFNTRVSPDLMPLVDLIQQVNSSIDEQFLLAEIICLALIGLCFLAVGLAWIPIMRRVQKETSALGLLLELPQAVLQEMCDSFAYVHSSGSAFTTAAFERRREQQQRKRVVVVAVLFAILAYCCVAWSVSQLFCVSVLSWTRRRSTSIAHFGVNEENLVRSTAFLRQFHTTQNDVRDHYVFHSLGFDAFGTTPAAHETAALSALEQLRARYNDMVVSALASAPLVLPLLCCGGCGRLAHTRGVQRVLFFDHCPGTNATLEALIDQYLGEQRALVLSAHTAVAANPELPTQLFGPRLDTSTALGSVLGKCIEKVREIHLADSRVVLQQAQVEGTLVFWLVYPAALLAFCSPMLVLCLARIC
eukprot:TRINITY_DN1114_c0_g1_i12.p1 TRINITY_DN1114_c0_g1~~TRINITY_DN1114_c0_g1_i12.p1  ORF type:complete len:384 (-),score=89.92 TRINITY_DN1114_c0_g1_i12:402-1553(-)